ncbi:MAG TPA: glycoside hydrolase family 15 protein, partial [Gaiellaceae bacterium]|nr:glycoside hydrolase family 15 protein [Gaiellaceae bacterium]
MTTSLSIADSLAAPTRPDYLPIAEHGVIGDLRTVALVGTEGTIDWYCPGRFDAPSVFGAILDKERGGRYTIAPAHDGWTSRQLYFPDTNVLITRFLTEDGVAEILDFMPIAGSGSGGDGRLIRTVLSIRGEMPFRIAVEPAFDYGRAAHETHVTEHGALFRSNGRSLALSSPVPLAAAAGGAYAEFVLAPDERMSFVLEPAGDRGPRPYSEEETRALFTETVDYWRRWISRSRYRGRWREMVDRSALTLKLLTYQPSGAIVAAPTTSLPEQLGGERNWDYRFTWIRDASFSLYALLRLGFSDEAAAFGSWLADRFRDRMHGESGPLQIMYGVD